MTDKKENVLIKSVSDYINVILEKKRTIEPERIIWFRGHASIKYELIPNLYRKTQYRDEKEKKPTISNVDSVIKIEGNIDMSFSRKAFSFFSERGIPDTPWYRYFLKQHYKIHTRLLDWTENALAALFFAVEDQTIKEDAEVLILLPSKLNNYSINKILKTNKNYSVIPSCRELPTVGMLCTEEGLLNVNQLMRKYYRLSIDKDEELFPIALYPPHLDERMSAQQACFTIFGNVSNGLASPENNEQFLYRISIEANSKYRIFNDLKTLGINYYSVFPDLDGLGRSIKDESYEAFDHARSIDNLDYYFS